ncbi:hypothetical protein DFQ26_003320 [Actinomortierella ambigua]|nr:hypothetical protein DFQ26_003320 [Actinomortierella ambigua]
MHRMDFPSFLPSFPPSKRLSALTLSSPTTSSSPVLAPEPSPAAVPLPAPPPLPHLSASRVLFEEGPYSDLVVHLQVPGTVKKSLNLHSRILTKESDFFATLLAGKGSLLDEKSIHLNDDKDANGRQVIDIQCIDANELYVYEACLRLLYTGSWYSEKDFQTNALDRRVRRGMDVMKLAGRLQLRGTTTAMLQHEVFDMCREQPELLEKVGKSLRGPEDKDDDQAILKFDRNALQAMCRVAVVKSEIRDHCELVIARNLYGSKKFRDLRMAEVQLSELRPGYIFPPGGEESIYLLKGAPSLPLHPCRASNVEALRHVVDHYTGFNSQRPLRTREFYVIPNDRHDNDDDEDDDDVDGDDNAIDESVAQKSQATLQHEATFYRVAFTTGYQWLLDQVIKVRAPFELVVLLLKDALDENADSRNNIYFGEFSSTADGDVYLHGVTYLTDGLLQAFQDPSLESFRNPGSSGSLLNMISYGINSLTDLPPLRARPKVSANPATAARHHLDYPALPTLAIEFCWQMLELALKRPHHLEFVQLLLESITKVAPLAPFEVVDRIEERLAELLEETRKRIMEQRGEDQQDDKADEVEDDDDKNKKDQQEKGDHTNNNSDDDDDDDEDGKDSKVASVDAVVKGSPVTSVRVSRDNIHRPSDDFDDRTSLISSVLLASEVSTTKHVPMADDTSSMHHDDDHEDEHDDDAADDEPEAEAPWMRPEYLQPLCLQLLTTFPMNIQSSLLWAIHDLQLL